MPGVAQCRHRCKTVIYLVKKNTVKYLVTVIAVTVGVVNILLQLGSNIGTNTGTNMKMKIIQSLYKNFCFDASQYKKVNSV